MVMFQSRASAPKLDSNQVVGLLALWSDGDGPLYAQLAEAFEGLIRSGTLRGGDRLPPERSLAEALAVSRGTVVRAFDRLVESGVLRRVQGSGTTIEGPASPALPAQGFVGEALWATGDRSIDLLKAIPTVLPEVLDTVAGTDLASFAAELDGAEPLGWWSLRERIAAHESTPERTITSHEVMVTTGAQQALAVALRAVVVPGDVVLGEEYTWPGLIDVVRHLGGRFQPVRMDAEGIDVEDLAHKVVRYRPALIAVNPQHHNPTGTRLPADRVAEVGRIAAEHRVMVVEDRVAADLGFDRRRLPAVASLTPDAPVVTVGSICKVAWPGLRLGWLHADAQTVNRFRAHKALDDMFTSALSQAAAVAVLDDYARMIEIRTDQLRARCDTVMAVLGAELGDWSFTRPRGGMCLWVTLPEGTSADAFARHAARFGVQLASGRQFGAVDADTRHIRLPFTPAPEVLDEGMRRVVAAWRSFDPTTAPPGAVM